MVPTGSNVPPSGLPVNIEIRTQWFRLGPRGLCAVKVTAKRDADLHLRMPAELKQALDDFASAESRRTTDYIILLLIEHVAKKSSKKSAR